MSVAALIEPLSCAVHGYDLLPTKLGDRFLIYGAGTMGLLLLSLAGRVGAISVTVVEPNESRRQMARAFEATAVVEGDDQLDDEGGFDVVIDASGVIGAIEDGLERVRPGGSYLQFGVAAAEAKASFSPYRLFSNEMSFVVTDSLPIASYLDALAYVRCGRGLKVQLAPENSLASGKSPALHP
jgi:threonine dehydrogenase-like Zn-dependent dehydrogenase